MYKATWQGGIVAVKQILDDQIRDRADQGKDIKPKPMRELIKNIDDSERAMRDAEVKLYQDAGLKYVNAGKLDI